MIKVTLTQEAKAELERLRSHSDSKNSERALYVLLNASGMSIPEIARSTHRHVLTIRNVIKGYLRSGIAGLKRKPAPGRPSNRNMSLKPLLSEILESSPEAYGYFEKDWTIKMMIDYYHKQTGKVVSHDTVQRSLKELDYSYKRSRLAVAPNAPSKDEKLSRVRQIIDEVRQALDDGDVEVIFIDETHVNTQPFIRRGWSKKKSADIYAYPTCQRGKNSIWRVEFAYDKVLLQICPKVQFQ